MAKKKFVKNREMNKKVVAFLMEYPLDLAGGAQMSTESLCMGLLKSEYKPVVICPHLLSKKQEDYPFMIITYDMGENRIVNLIKRVAAFRKIIKALNPDIVHVQMPESLVTYGLTGIRPMEKGGPAFIFTDRGLFYGYRKHTMLLMKWTLKKAQLLLTTTQFNKQLWEKGSKIRPIGMVANTISDKFIEYDDEKRRALRAGDDRLSIGLAGRICEEKNWPFAVSLIQQVAAAGIPIRVKLVLSVFEKGDDDRVKSIVEGIEKAIGSENLEFHQDYNQQQMQEYYYGVDVFVMTSCFESFGKAAVEAMSRKCAVISTAVGGLPEVIGKEDNLYTVDTVQRAVDYIRKASEDKQFLQEEQEYFYRRYKDNFTKEKCLKDHLKVYKEILS